MTNPTYIRIYADADGESHVEDVHLPLRAYSSPTGTEDERSESIDVAGLVFRTVVAEASDTEPHTAPRRLLIVLLDGRIQVEVSDGEVRELGPGGALLLEDTTGKGHITRSLSAGPRRTLLLHLGDES